MKVMKFSKSFQRGEDGRRVAVDPFGAGGERGFRRPQGGFPAQQVDGGGAQQAHEATRRVGLQHPTVLAEAVVGDVEEPVLDPPVAAAQRQDPRASAKFVAASQGGIGLAIPMLPKPYSERFQGRGGAM